VRETGGEAIADTSWSILTESGDPVRELVGAYASMVLAEGTYAIVAKNRDRIYQRDFTVVAGRNQEVEVLAVESAATTAASDLDAAD
jgi:ribonuclease PH